MDKTYRSYLSYLSYLSMAREEISLNARWSLACFEDGEGVRLGASRRSGQAGEWMDAVVPGDVHLDLMRAGKIADPFVGLNHLDAPTL